MVIYGVALLSFCMLMGVFVGDILGEIMGVQANVGGVGIAMLLLLVLSNLGSRKLALKPITENGIGFGVRCTFRLSWRWRRDRTCSLLYQEGGWQSSLALRRWRRVSL